MHRTTWAALLVLSLTGASVTAQETDGVRIDKAQMLAVEAGKVRRIPGELRLTDDSLVFRRHDGTMERRLDLLAIDSVYALFGSARTRGSAVTGWLALGLTGALISRSQEEFVLLRVRGLDSLEVWSFKVPNLKAMEVGNAIWAKWKARTGKDPPPGGEPNDASEPSPRP